MIFENTSFGRTLGLLERGMDVNRLRSQVISNNIANAQTPNFKRTDINFEAELKRSLDFEKVKDGLMKAKKTAPGHFDFPTPVTWDSVHPRAVLDHLSTVKNNGNNVDLERETSESAKNGLTYAMLTELTRFQFNQINMVTK
ncbi:MAG: flagellar basal body rod protein FlgB [Spirochaetia bacterium]